MLVCEYFKSVRIVAKSAYCLRHVSQQHVKQRDSDKPCRSSRCKYLTPVSSFGEPMQHGNTRIEIHCLKNVFKALVCARENSRSVVVVVLLCLQVRFVKSNRRPYTLSAPPVASSQSLVITTAQLPSKVR